MAVNIWDFGSDAEGLKFTISYDSATNKFTVTVLTGSMNVNALYWGDGDNTASEGSYSGFSGAKSESSLNMNGTGEVFDGGLKISDAGLGKTPPSSYITANPDDAFPSSFTIDAGSFDPAKFGTIGVRATSTSTEGGSIKWIDDAPRDNAPPPPANHFPTGDMSHFDLYFDKDGNSATTNDMVVFRVANVQAVDKTLEDIDTYLKVVTDKAIADGLITTNSLFLGAAIKQGNNDPVFYAADNDPNDVDAAPTGYSNLPAPYVYEPGPGDLLPQQGLVNYQFADFTF
jgi:hypothetical protein